jgi:integrase
VAIKSDSFKFAELFPNSRKKDYFTEKERLLFGGNLTPARILFKDYAQAWYDLLRDSDRVNERSKFTELQHAMKMANL